MNGFPCQCTWQVALKYRSGSLFGKEATPALISWSMSIQGTIEKLNANTRFNMQSCLQLSRHWRRTFFLEDEALRLIRDGVIWNLLDSSSWQSKDPHDQNVDTLTKVATTGLIFLDSSRHKFQTALWSQVARSDCSRKRKGNALRS